MSKKQKEDPADLQEGFKKRLFCWIRKRRAALALHKTLYYDKSVTILEDTQFDFLEAELLAVEKRHPDVAQEVTTAGYWSPHTYVGSARVPAVTAQAERLWEDWTKKGKPTIAHIPHIQPNQGEAELYTDALKRIIIYPI